MNNLPDGVRISDIPGNRPQDVAIDQAMEKAWDTLPLRFEETMTILGRIQTAEDPAEFANACYDFMNLWEPSTQEEKIGRKDSGHLFEVFLSRLEDAAHAATYDPREAYGDYLYDRMRDEEFV